METPRILHLDPAKPDPDVLEDAVGALSRGGLVVVPTETVYGLAADPGVPGAMERLYSTKGRPEQKPVALFVTGVAQAEAEGAAFGRAARALAEKYWPGPLTLVLETARGRVGFRIPDHPVPLELVRRANRPLAVTSANRSGKNEARTADAALAELGTAVDVVLDAGPVGDSMPSTVVSVIGEKVQILRSGAIPDEAIEEVVAKAK